MSWRSFSLVVPLFNEEERVGESGPALADFIAGYPAGSELILVDDGSDDATVAVARRLMADRPEVPIRLLSRVHAGKGAAVRAGLDVATAEYAGFCDVDLSTPLDQFEHVVTAAFLSPSLAIGSRDAALSHLVRPESPLRELLGKTYNRLVQLRLTPGVRDTQCGAKAAATEVWRSILPWCQEEGFAWDVEAVALARCLGFPVREVAVAWSHDDRSRVRVGRDGFEMVRAVPRIARHLHRVPAGVGAGQPLARTAGKH
ncbi:MAG: glycosyltransferase [Acidimicrobiales bacterium]